MAIGKARSNRQAAIDDKALFLKTLLNHYPELFRKWFEKEDEACKAAAKDFADGDEEIAWNAYFTNSSYLDIEAETEPLFYNAMALMAYSYYESTISLWAKDWHKEKGKKCEENIRALREKLGFTISDKASECQQKIYCEFRVIRNHIAHHNEDKSREKDEDIIEQACKTIPELHRIDDTLYFTGGNYISEIIDRIHFVLREMQDKIEEKEKHKAFRNG